MTTLNKPVDATSGTIRPALLGCPFDHHSSFLRGAAGAPESIRRALRSPATNLWSETGIELASPVPIHDAGDVRCAREEDFVTAIETAVAGLIDQGFSPLVLGGDHAVTYPILRGFASRFASLDMLVFDAHPDLYDHFRGDRLSHACPCARIAEEGLVTRLVQIGIRAGNDHQREQARRLGVTVHEMKDAGDFLGLEFHRPLYISFDMDVLDPAFAPGVSHHEPGGFSTREAIRIIQRLRAPVIVGGDVVETNPVRDPEGVTAAAAAKILKEMAAKMLSVGRPA